MIFKLKLIFLSLWFVFCSFILSQAAEFEIPVLTATTKTAERNTSMGPLKSLTQNYTTSLPYSRVLAFYKKELSEAGWQEKRIGVFAKNNYLFRIEDNSNKKNNKQTEFSITTSLFPTAEEIIALRKSKPDKLTFMPVYPGSEQIFLWDLPTGVSGAYQTENSIKEVVFFYNSGMLNYGWSLISEVPIYAKAANCPKCQKVPVNSGAGKLEATENLTGVHLFFRRTNGETCKVTVSNLSIGLPKNIAPRPEDNLAEPKGFSSNKTTIAVNYNAHK
jgi:hypothetical protein